MSHQWYYVEDKERIGPVAESDLTTLVSNGVLTPESYIWRKGFDNWQKFGEVDEVSHLLSPQVPPPGEVAPVTTQSDFDWAAVSTQERVFSIKVGLDRGASEVEYGPFNLEELKRAYKENRINAKTFVFAPGMSNWSFLADLPIFESLFQEMPPIIDDVERRMAIRRPFVARLFFHDQKVVYEGVCRDISVGGLQVLVSSFPGNSGDDVTMNVHPDNSEYNFVASGKIVRVLEGGQGFSLRFLDLSPEAEQSIRAYINTV